MTRWNKTWKRSRSVALATVLASVLASCGGSPPPLPPPPPANGAGGGGYVGAASCGSMTGQPIWNAPISATFSSGASATLNFGVQLSNLTGSVSFYLPDLAGTQSYTPTNQSANICLSTSNQNGGQAPGQYNGGYIQANLYGSVPISTIYTGYGQVTVIGTGYGGTPTQYAMASGYITGTIINGVFSGQAVVSIPNYNGYYTQLRTNY